MSCHTYHVLSDTVSGSAYNTSVHTTTIKCLFSGQWDRSAPTCVAVMCPNAPPSTPDNARREILFQVLSPITISVVFCGSKPESCPQTNSLTSLDLLLESENKTREISLRKPKKVMSVQRSQFLKNITRYVLLQIFSIQRIQYEPSLPLHFVRVEVF